MVEVANVRQDGASLGGMPETAGDSGTPSSASEEEPLELDQVPATDEMAGLLAERESKLLTKIDKLRQQKQDLRAMLTAYQRKEREFVAQMDSHMDEVERTEHSLSLRIETLTAENHQLRSLTDKRAKENSTLADKLNETTKHCSESETRVQFLVDRIVALLSAGSGDAAQTETVVSMRQHEREMLRQLEETRQQFDEVRQQNGELTSRLTEELGLSRRLQDQLAEVEERFFHHGRERAGAGGLGGGAGSSPQVEDGALAMGMGRLGTRPLGLRSDQTEAPERAERPSLPELPPPISEAEEPQPPQADQGASTPRGDLGNHGSALESVREDRPSRWEASPEPADHSLEVSMQLLAGQDLLGPDDGRGGSAVGDTPEASPDASPQASFPEPPLAAESVPGTERAAPGPAGDACGTIDALATAPRSWPAKTPEEVLVMERKLREALESSSFECAVIRVESGVYNFGPNVRALVELTAEREVVASADGGPFEPIEDFIRDIARASLGTSACGSASEPGKWTAGHSVAASGASSAAAPPGHTTQQPPAPESAAGGLPGGGAPPSSALGSSQAQTPRKGPAYHQGMHVVGSGGACHVMAPGAAFRSMSPQGDVWKSQPRRVVLQNGRAAGLDPKVGPCTTTILQAHPHSQRLVEPTMRLNAPMSPPSRRWGASPTSTSPPGQSQLLQQQQQMSVERR